ncbi:hypothetical protein C8J57DRAFT_1227074 [Mycena rebaudengoi]|nr:hypothetical protein C8J57DRAFT_1227074 [Mycena rebaudengoi]
MEDAAPEIEVDSFGRIWMTWMPCMKKWSARWAKDARRAEEGKHQNSEHDSFLILALRDISIWTQLGTQHDAQPQLDPNLSRTFSPGVTGKGNGRWKSDGRSCGMKLGMKLRVKSCTSSSIFAGIEAVRRFSGLMVGVQRIVRVEYIGACCTSPASLAGEIHLLWSCSLWNSARNREDKVHKGTITTAVLLASGSTGLQVLPVGTVPLITRGCMVDLWPLQRSGMGTLRACQNADLQPPCKDFEFIIDTCTTFTGYNDLVRSVAAEGDLLDLVLDCTLYENNCTNGGKSVSALLMLSALGLPLVSYNVPDDLKDEVSNFKLLRPVVVPKSIDRSKLYQSALSDGKYDEECVIPSESKQKLETGQKFRNELHLKWKIDRTEDIPQVRIAVASWSMAITSSRRSSETQQKLQGIVIIKKRRRRTAGYEGREEDRICLEKDQIARCRQRTASNCCAYWMAVKTAVPEFLAVLASDFKHPVSSKAAADGRVVRVAEQRVGHRAYYVTAPNSNSDTPSYM